MTSRGPDWDIVISNLARHLASAPNAEQVETILSDADRDLSHLRAPCDFWSRVRASYERTLGTRVSSAVPTDVVRGLLASRTSKEKAAVS
jgi:hypothetical protein